MSTYEVSTYNLFSTPYLFRSPGAVHIVSRVFAVRDVRACQYAFSGAEPQCYCGAPQPEGMHGGRRQVCENRRPSPRARRARLLVADLIPAYLLVAFHGLVRVLGVCITANLGRAEQHS